MRSCFVQRDARGLQPPIPVSDAKMTYKIIKSENDKYIVIQVNGPMSRDLAIEIAGEADKKRKELNMKNLLYDVRNSRNIETVTSNYFFAYKDMEKLNLNRTSRVAILTSPSDDSHDFVETAIRNAGYNVRLFKEEEPAIAWLEETDS